MKDVFQEARAQLSGGHKAVVATVVRTKGSTPQKPGAKLLVREDGTGVGTLGGGCVEGDIWFAAKELLSRGGSAQYREYELNEDLAAEDGLICGGTMYFLIDPIYRPEELLSYAEEIDAAYEGQGSVALASLIKLPGEHDGPLLAGTGTGRKLFIRENGTTNGTLGTDALDSDAVGCAMELMAHGRNEYVVASDGTEYFIEAYTTPPKLILAGGGHVSNAISPLAEKLGFQVYITDDRAEFANPERFPGAVETIVARPEDAIPALPTNRNTFIIIATRGHRYDNVALAAAAATPARYVGLLGSKRKTILIYEDLLRMGVSLERLRELRAPIGLDIHARTPDEIAISIMAEMLMFRLGGTGAVMKLADGLVDKAHAKYLSSAGASERVPEVAVSPSD
jgi:xanthine dehydrogenase accessory factor